MSSFKVSNKSVCMLADFIEYILISQNKEIGYNITRDTKENLKKSLFAWNKPKNEYYLANIIHEELYMMNCQALIVRYGADEINRNYESYKPSNISFTLNWTNDSKMSYYKVTDIHFQLLKTLQCYLYQCAEGDIPKTYDLYKVLRTLSEELMRFIISNDVRYCQAQWG